MVAKCSACEVGLFHQGLYLFMSFPRDPAARLSLTWNKSHIQSWRGGWARIHELKEWWISANASHWMALVSVCAIWREHVCHKRHSPSHRGTPTRCSATQFSLKLCSAQRAHFKLHSLGAYTSKMWPPGLRCALWLICLGLFVLALTHGNWLLLWPESFVFLLPVISQSLFPHFEKTMQNGKSVVSVSVSSLGVKFFWSKIYCLI